MIRELHLTTSYGRYGFTMDDRFVTEIRDACQWSANVETGGILIGYYTEDKSIAIVTEVLKAPKDSKSGRTWFRRGFANLRQLLARRWRKHPRTYYLGEWHYHPASQVVPSDDDIRQMKMIGYSDNYHCQEPIMLIAGMPNAGFPMRAFVFPRGEKHLELLPKSPTP